MRVLLKIVLASGLLVFLSGCSQSGILTSPSGDTTSTVELSGAMVKTESPTTTLMPTATATITATPAPTEVPFPPRLDCGEVFCQQTWRGLLTRPFSTDYKLTIDPTYPYANTKNDTMDPHHGVEFPNGYGTPILAAQSGTVVFAGSDDLTVIGPYTSFYGNVIIILHPGLYEGRDLYTLYGHLSEIQVNEGDAVALGQVIGKVGATGAADGPHLHFEVRLDENSYAATTNPMLWFAPLTDETGESMSALAGYIVNRYGTPLDRFTLSLERLDETGAVIETYYPITYFPAGVNGFPTFGEDFVMPDIPPGDYRLAFINGSFYQIFFTLEPGCLGFINLQMD